MPDSINKYGSGWGKNIISNNLYFYFLHRSSVTLQLTHLTISSIVLCEKVTNHPNYDVSLLMRSC